MKKLFVNLLFIPVCFTAFSQSAHNRENTPASGCGATTMILRHPENTIVCPGSNAVFISEVNYRQYGLATWQQSIDNGNTWQPVSSPYLQSGGNHTDTLQLLSAADSVANRLYRAVYSQPCSSYIKILSAPAKLMVGIQPLQLLQQPHSESVCVGNNAAFTVRAAGNPPGYQWQLSTDHGNTFRDIAGAVQQALQLTGVTIAQNGYLYRCIISSACAGTITSDAAALTVHPSSVSITSQPTDQQICYGSPATLSVVASGASVNYQWQKSYDGVNYFTIDNSDSAVLEIPWISEGANLHNRFRCIILSQCSALRSNDAAVYYVRNPAMVPARSVAKCAGDTIVFTALLPHESFYEQLYQYQWQKSTDNGGTYQNIENANGNYYWHTITPAEQNNTLFRCRISNMPANCIDAYSNITTVYVNQPFDVTGQPVNQHVCEGATAGFSVSTTGSVSGYQWQVSTDNGSAFANIFNNYSAATANLQLSRITREQNNTLYRCRITSSCQNADVFSDTVQLFADTIPDLIADTSVIVECDTCNTDISNIFPVNNITSASWSTPNPGQVTQGVYYYSVSANNSCADKAAVFVNIKKNDTIKACNRSIEKISAGITGTHYQWQKKEGYYFTNIQDGYIENGVNSPTLQVYYPGYRPVEYRCLVDSTIYSNTFYIIAANTWNGSVSNDWADPKNWNCGYVPSEYDEVIIPPNVSPSPEIRNHQAVARLSVFNNSNITILQGIIFRIMGYPKY